MNGTASCRYDDRPQKLVLYGLGLSLAPTGLEEARILRPINGSWVASSES